MEVVLTIKLDNYERLGIADWDRELFTHDYKKALQLEFAEQTDTHLEDFSSLEKANYFFFEGLYNLAAELYEHLSKRINDPINVLLRLLHCYDSICDWQNRTLVEKKILKRLDQNTYPALIEPLCYLSVPINLVQSSRLAKERYRTIVTNDFYKSTLRMEKLLGNRLHIGYCSIDFRAHHCGVPLWPMINEHNHDQFKVSIFSAAPAKKNKILRSKFDAKNINFYSLSGKSFGEAASIIQSHDLDILVDTTRNIRSNLLPLFSQKLAELQITSWGYGGSSGAECFDALISDNTIITDSEESDIVEKPVKLSNYLPISRVVAANYDNMASRIENNLPKNKIVFGCFSNHYKICDKIFALWAEILRNTKSVLWLSEGNEQSRKNLKAAAKRYALDSKRLIFAHRTSQEHHNARLKLVDIFLDNPYLGSSSNVYDGLMVGCPGLVLNGETPETRGSASILISLGLREYIFKNGDEYVTSAIKMANDTKLLNWNIMNVRKILNKSVYSLKGFVGELEANYLEMANKKFN